MVPRDENKYIIWPIYFDKSVSKGNGRKVSKEHAVEKPSLEGIAKAAKSLGLHPVLEKNCAYPSRHWKNEGRVLVDKKGSKNRILVHISNRL